MKTRDYAQTVQNLEKVKDFPTLDVADFIDFKVDKEMDKVLATLEEMKRENSKDRWLFGIGFTLMGVLITAYKFLG